ncbi:MAG: hypothetical protein ACI9J3_002186 [Parvicellaceae bacterium]
MHELYHYGLNLYFMFGLFKKKSEIEKLEYKYNQLLKEAYTLSTSNRRLSDTRTAEANDVLKQIELLKKNP